MGHWDQALFLQVLFSPLVLKAAWTTVWVGTVAQAIGTAIGLLVAPLLMNRLWPIRLVPNLYSWIFRGTPLLAQILFFYAVLPQLGLRLGVLESGLLALGLNEGARMAEIVRAGLLSVPDQQREAANALGLNRFKTFILVVLPQAMRAIIPPLGNNYSYMLKATSLLSAISFTELLRTSQQLAQSTAHPLEIYAVAALWYMAIITIVTLLQKQVEHALRRSEAQRSTRLREDAPEAGIASRPTAEVLPLSAVRPVLEAYGIVKRLGQTLAVNAVDFRVMPGEVVFILGPSGSGKSTLLRCLNMLEQPDAGTVLLEGKTMGRSSANGQGRISQGLLDRQRRRLGMVFQRFNLFEHLTAEENLTVGLRRVLGLSPSEASGRARELLAQFGLAGFEKRYPSELSGGQKQRVAIARAISMNPVAILFDEPTSSLDPEMVGEVLAAMRALAQAGKTMIIVSHEIGFARAAADRVIIMHDGCIIEQGTPASVFDNPAHPRTRQFLAAIAGHVRDAA